MFTDLKRGCLGFKTKLYPVVRFKFWSLEEYPICSHYSKLHSNREWLYLLSDYLYAK